MTDSTLNAALAAAQAEFPLIPKNKEVTVRPRDGGTPYKFKYATLETIFGAVRPALAKNGLSLSHRIDLEEGKTKVVAVLAHKDGGKAECPFPIQLSGKMQEQGSAITYARRYTAQCILGVAADDDDDANTADGNTIEDSRESNGKKFAKPALTPSPAEKKASEIEAAFRAAKDAASLAKIGADNKAHIDAMSDALQDKLRGIYQECMNIVSPRKAA